MLYILAAFHILGRFAFDKLALGFLLGVIFDSYFVAVWNDVPQDNVPFPSPLKCYHFQSLVLSIQIIKVLQTSYVACECSCSLDSYQQLDFSDFTKVPERIAALK